MQDPLIHLKPELQIEGHVVQLLAFGHPALHGLATHGSTTTAFPIFIAAQIPMFIQPILSRY
jgi:hypothetical protein